MGSRRWSNVTKIIVIASLAVLTIVLIVTFRAMVTPTIVAFFLAFILSYPVNWIQRSTGWARSVVITLIYVILLAAISLAPVIIIPRSAELVLSLRDALEELVTNLQNASVGPLIAISSFEFSLDSLYQETGNALSNILLLATGDPLSIARGVTNSIIAIIYVAVLNFWILKDMHKLQRLILERIPADYQEDAHRVGRELGQIWDAFLRGQVTLALAIGILTWIPLVIVGMPNAGGLALLAAVMEFLPSIGPGISLVVGTAVALFQGSTWMPISNLAFAVIVLIIYVIIAQIEQIYLIPRLVGSKVQLHPAVTFVAIISGTIVFGLLGVLLATPIVASARTLLTYIHRKLLDLEPFEELTPPESTVRIPGLIAGRKIDAVIFDLDGTLAQVDWAATNWAAKHFVWLNRFFNPTQRSHLVRRLMIGVEGLTNFAINQARRFGIKQDLDSTFPFLNIIRGYPPIDEIQPMDRTAEMLGQLDQQYQLALVSTRPNHEIGHFFTTTQIPPGTFDMILGRESVRNLLPHSEALLAVSTHLDVEPNQILVVSDSDNNLRSARAAQMATSGVLCGLAEEADLVDADLVLDTTADIVEWL
jgi:predicted PurR-regulated permease PerM/phosphoglycolate phosphatase-like HAD superfamily hydrolase